MNQEPWRQGELGVLREFEVWLPSIDGRSRSETTAGQYTSHMGNIVKEGLEGDVSNLKKFKDFAKPGHLWDKLKKRVSAQTVSTYMHALSAFLEFCMCNKKEYMTKEEYTDGMTTVAKWVRSLKTLKTLQRHAQQEKEESAVSKVAEMMKVYFQMDYHRDAVVMIGNMQQTEHTTDASKFLQCRNDLIIRILLRNGQRSGTMRNATFQEYKAMKAVEDHFIFKVSSHVRWTSIDV